MDTQKLIPNSEPSPQSSVTSIKQIFHQEIEQTSDEILMIVLDFLIFMKSRSSSRSLITKTNPSTAASLLETLQTIDQWKGDDFYECLELVHASRSSLYSVTDQKQSETLSKG